MILCNFVRNDEIIGNTDAISYETKKSGAWRSSCHMPDFFCLVPIFINFLLKYSSHISTHMEIFSHLPARHTLSNKFLLKYSSEPDSLRSPASLPPQNKCYKTNRKSWQSQASVSGRFPCSPIHRIIFLRVSGSQVSRPPSQKRRKPKIIRNAAT